jgi:hypothetical protein
LRLVLLIVFKIEAYLSLFLEDWLGYGVFDVMLVLEEGFSIEDVPLRIVSPHVPLVMQRSVLVSVHGGLLFAVRRRLHACLGVQTLGLKQPLIVPSPNLLGRLLHFFI